jgi:hypothetical protein
MLHRHGTSGPSTSNLPVHDTAGPSTYEPYAGSYPQIGSTHDYMWTEEAYNYPHTEHTHEYLGGTVMDMFCGHDISGPSSSQSFLSDTDLTLYTSIITDFFGHDVMDTDEHATIEHPDFQSPPLAVRRERQGPQSPPRYTPS